MRRQVQLIKHDPDNGHWGDCFRTGIACLLDVPAFDVPHFCDGGGLWEDARNRRKIQQYLAKRGLELLRWNISADGDQKDVYGVMSFWHKMNRRTPFLMTVQGSNTSCSHIIVCKDRQIFCDPVTGKIGRTSDFKCLTSDEGEHFWEVWFLGPKYPLSTRTGEEG